MVLVDTPETQSSNDEGDVQYSAPDRAPTSNGFRAKLDGLSLFDLVQVECLARAKRVIRVVSAGRSGYLFFGEGQVVHATTRTAIGERAAIEMLSWTDGTFEPCEAAWPERTTITRHWQSLLLLATKAQDEHAAGKLVHLPARRSGASPDDPDDPPTSVTSRPPPPPVTSHHGDTSMKESSPSKYRRAVRIDPSGTVISRAGDVTEFAGFAAYAARLADLLGRSLGADRLMSLEIELEGSRAIVYVEESGNVVAVEAPTGVDLGSVARRAGL